MVTICTSMRRLISSRRLQAAKSASPPWRSPLTLTIPPRTNANRTFRLRGKGMPYLREPNKRGDMFARVKLVLPDSLTDQEVDSITALASARQKQAGTKRGQIMIPENPPSKKILVWNI